MGLCIPVGQGDNSAFAQQFLYIHAIVGYSNDGDNAMSYISVTIEREAARLSALLDLYEKQLDALPKGSLRAKKRAENSYYYLSYRKDDKVVTDYVGNDEITLNSLKEQLERRQNIERLRKAIKHELRLMNKAMEAAR